MTWITLRTLAVNLGTQSHGRFLLPVRDQVVLTAAAVVVHSGQLSENMLWRWRWQWQHIDERLWKLHLRRSLGEALTADEQSDLDVWYAEQDQAEALALGLSSEANELSPLKQQVDTILERIVATSQSIQAIANENEVLRRENLALRQQLAQRRVLQPV